MVLPSPFDLLAGLQELVDTMDRRGRHVERAGESQIAPDAERLRASAMQRIASLRAWSRRAVDSADCGRDCPSFG